ncbi:MAG: UDP-N-acetylmuramoyl-tripeptide--D-alanyl-D-alanine ligase [Clostridia bacterium]|nr:UDP-N-acetylmuramoyl-tripeptide--D-alanyl-D-alanine ligase [Clostridia bacterium]
MKKISINDIVTATGGRLIQKSKETFVTGIWHDSREVSEGDMFVAIEGENRDGHMFIPQVVEKGCRTVLVSHTGQWLAELDDTRQAVNAILVEDTVEAMGKLAAWYLKSLDIRRVAVTGSVGKTSTRDMIYYVLGEKYSCGRNLKNYNNNIGLPISIFQFDENTRAAVLEMGMDAFGEIDYLSGIVKPEIGVITNIGVAHMEKLGSRDGIFRAKMEIAGNILPKSEGGTLVFAGDNEFLTKAGTSGDYDQIEVGKEKNADLVISDVDDFGIEGIKFTAVCDGEKAEVKLPVPGTHNAINAGLALAVGKRLGISLEEGAAGLAGAELTGSRLRKIKGKNITIIDDTYNANPDSMKSALDVLKKSEAKRRVAILGDMFELGDQTELLHRGVGVHARKIGIDEVICIGDLAENISEGAVGTHFPDKETFLKVIEDYIREGDLVLVKASRGMALEKIVEKLETL